jgi:hypothetical protein
MMLVYVLLVRSSCWINRAAQHLGCVASSFCTGYVPGNIDDKGLATAILDRLDDP